MKSTPESLRPSCILLPNPYAHPVFSYIYPDRRISINHKCAITLFYVLDLASGGLPVQSPTMMVVLQSLLVLSCFGAQS